MSLSRSTARGMAKRSLCGEHRRWRGRPEKYPAITNQRGSGEPWWLPAARLSRLFFFLFSHRHQHVCKTEVWSARAIVRLNTSIFLRSHSSGRNVGQHRFHDMPIRRISLFSKLVGFCLLEVQLQLPAALRTSIAYGHTARAFGHARL